MTDEWASMHGALVRLPVDMPDDLLAAIVNLAATAPPHNQAEYIKNKLDEEFAPHWHVTIGNSFGSHVVHQAKKFVYFYLNNRAHLIYKMGQ